MVGAVNTLRQLSLLPLTLSLSLSLSRPLSVFELHLWIVCIRLESKSVLRERHSAAIEAVKLEIPPPESDKECSSGSERAREIETERVDGR